SGCKPFHIPSEVTGLRLYLFICSLLFSTFIQGAVLSVHYIRSPRTLHSLYPVSPGPCIYYIWSPRTLHSLYLIS
ncbi:unnamed protein product, partial [Staurois parvus]